MAECPPEVGVPTTVPDEALASRDLLLYRVEHVRKALVQMEG